MTDNKDKVELEVVKMVVDFLKHLTTLSTGSIVILAAFYDKFGANVTWKPLAAAAVFFFLISVLGSLIGNGVVVFRAEKGDLSLPEGGMVHVQYLPYMVCFVSFFLAVLMLGIFAVRNLL